MLVLTLMPAPRASASPCEGYDVKPRMGQERVERIVTRLIRCAATRWDVEVTTSLRVAKCESSMWPWANNGGKFLGVYQHAASSWVDRVNTYLRPRWFNDRQWNRLHTTPGGAFLARANVIMSMRMVHQGGWSPWACS
jgi:hypothetical protein